ncbi:hypothetical protein DC008_35160 [Streptomyces nigra]|nr:hypothetical protein DC008_35160 [Streptomyces nigra]
MLGESAGHLAQHGRVVLWGQYRRHVHDLLSSRIHVVCLLALGPVGQDLRRQHDKDNGEDAEDDSPGRNTDHFGRDTDTDAGDGKG